MKPVLAALFVLAFVMPASAEPEKKDLPATKSEPKRFKFEFRDKRWRDVFEWLSQQTGLPITGSIPPLGIFSFVPAGGRTYTIPEIVDILNDGLRDQQYRLELGANRIALGAIKEASPPPAERAPSVELIEVGSIEPAKAAQTLKAMFTDVRGMYVEADVPRNGVIVRGTPEQIVQIKLALRVLDTVMPISSGARIITLETGSAADLADEIARMLGQLRKDIAVRVVAPGQAPPMDSPKNLAKTITVLAAGNRLIITGESAEALAMANEVARLYVSAGDKPGDFVVLKLKHADATSAAKLLDEMFNGPRAEKRPAERIRVVADPTSNSLLVRASPIDLLTIRRLLQTNLDAEEPEPQAAVQTFLIGPLKHAKATELANLVREVYRNDKSSRGFTATADQRTNTLVLRCARPLFEDAKRVVEQLDSPADAKKQ